MDLNDNNERWMHIITIFLLVDKSIFFLLVPSPPLFFAYSIKPSQKMLRIFPSTENCPRIPLKNKAKQKPQQITSLQMFTVPHISHKTQEWGNFKYFWGQGEKSEWMGIPSSRLKERGYEYLLWHPRIIKVKLRLSICYLSVISRMEISNIS